MSDPLEVRVDAGALPRDAVYAAAFAFTDRCYVRLTRPEAGGVGVVLREKAAGTMDAHALAAEVREELARQALRQRLEEEGGDLMREIAVGSPADPLADAGLDDLLAAPDGFDDPLGIATSWEEKHARKAEVEGSAGAGPRGEGA